MTPNRFSRLEKHNVLPGIFQNFNDNFRDFFGCPFFGTHCIFQNAFTRNKRNRYAFEHSFNGNR